MDTSHRAESVELVKKMTISGRKFHFIGAGGIGMSGLAALMMANGARVSGSDQNENEFVAGLRGLGADIFAGHAERNIPEDIDEIVISAAIKPENPEMRAAARRNIKVSKYAHMLGQLMQQYKGIAVAGTHGKSTTCGWLVQLMSQAGMDPSFIVGARINQLGDSWKVGRGECFVAEACEYDRSFLNLRPQIGCILNIEQDHLDYYANVDEIVEAFECFAGNVRPGGALVINGDDVNCRKLPARLENDIRCVTFGQMPDNYYRADDIALVDGLYSFDVIAGQRKIARTPIAVAGAHNINNALAVVAMAVEAGLDEHSAVKLLDEFTGIDRRLMLKAVSGGITIMDDYAHHPTEIRASLQAIRQFHNPARLWCVFQPHQYSRTRFLLDDFAESFKLADVVVMPEIYFVRDTIAARQQVNSQVLVDKINKNGSSAVFIDGFEPICEYLKKNVRKDELIVTMGAGDVWKVADEYIRWLG